MLQKNPAKRLSWPEILNHPFVKDHILISNDDLSMPLTRPLSAKTMQAKEQQKKEHTKAVGQSKYFILYYLQLKALSKTCIYRTKKLQTSQSIKTDVLETLNENKNESGKEMKNESFCEDFANVSISNKTQFRDVTENEASNSVSELESSHCCIPKTTHNSEGNS